MAEVIGAEELFRVHAGFVASFVHRLGVPRSDVSDVVQEVFLVAHDKGGFTPRGTAKPRTWIAAIAVRKAAQYRRKKRELLGTEQVERAMSAARTPADEVSTRQSLGRVQQCLDALDLDHRAVFVLFEIEGHACDEIARTLEIPVGTVYSRLHTARKRFVRLHTHLSTEPTGGDDV